MTCLSLQMWYPYRQTLIAEHIFYVEQAQKRLLSQFGNISAEADQAEKNYLEVNQEYFNPAYHDESDFYESAHNKGIEFYQLLSDMHESTRLSIIAAMYHQWEKNLKKWLLLEMRHWGIGKFVTNSIWRQDFSQIVCLFSSFGFDLKELPVYCKLNAMRLVVNVFKHGDGNSFEELKISYPELIPKLTDSCFNAVYTEFLNYSDMQISDKDLDDFSNAIWEFWKMIPAEIKIDDEIDAPKWFEKAILQDAGK